MFGTFHGRYKYLNNASITIGLNKTPSSCIHPHATICDVLHVLLEIHMYLPLELRIFAIFNAVIIKMEVYLSLR